MFTARTATFARIQHYVDGTPDPRTATCEQHKVAAPYSDTAKGDGVAVPESSGWACVVCPEPYADLIGTPVIGRSYSSVYVYGGGDGQRDGMTSLSVSLRGGPSVLKCAPTDVAPADTPTDEKNPRISIEKMPKKRDYQDSGVWLPHIDHPMYAAWNPRGEKTKRDALAGAARRLAIADYHAGRKQEN